MYEKSYPLFLSIKGLRGKRNHLQKRAGLPRHLRQLEPDALQPFLITLLCKKGYGLCVC